MIAAATTAAAPPATHSMPFSWFDMVVVVLLGFGLLRGRRNGMSKELLPLLQWLVVVPACGLAYPLLTKVVADSIPDKVWSCVVAYLALALLVFIVFAILKQQIGEKLGKSNFFKGGEYYLGMLSGMVRYACLGLFVLALLNARVYTPVEKAQMKAYDERNFGGGIFSGNYFPHLFQVQDVVFKDSYTGQLVKDNLGMLLINTDPTSGQPPKPPPVIKIGN
jgi:uncharacterized membrane protein required for colicin V production